MLDSTVSLDNLIFNLIYASLFFIFLTFISPFPLHLRNLF
nr:MAG TPA: hypothetical protein [Caudoviricetes sp.]